MGLGEEIPEAPRGRGAKIMKTFDVQGIDLQAPQKRAFSYIADPIHLPQWTSAFASVANGRAVMRTPNGEIEIDLAVRSSEEQGTIDWVMAFPDGSVATAFSRIVKLDSKSCVFTFVLTPPPVPLEQLEGALEAQSRTLAEELQSLKRILERHG
jgi:hypothetical protein